jgi:hypothetical protein
VNENGMLDEKNKYDKNLHSADAQQVKYTNQSTSILSTVYKYTFYVYMILAVILCGVIFFKAKFSIPKQIFLYLLILLFPFYIYAVENILYIAAAYLYNLVLSNIYSNGFSTTQMEYGGANLQNQSVSSLQMPKLKPQLNNLSIQTPDFLKKIGGGFTKAGSEIKSGGENAIAGIRKTGDKTIDSMRDEVAKADDAFKIAWKKSQDAAVKASNAIAKAADVNIIPELKSAAEEAAEYAVALADILKAQSVAAEEELKKVKKEYDSLHE